MGRGVLEVELHLESTGVLEVLPFWDRDRDGLLSEEEFAGHAAELGQYVLEHYRLSEGGRALRPEAYPRLRLDPGVLIRGSWVELSWSVPLPNPPSSLTLEVDLFESTSPGHVEVTRVDWLGSPLPLARLGPGSASHTFDPPRRSVWAALYPAGLRRGGLGGAWLLLVLAAAGAGWAAMLAAWLGVGAGFLAAPIAALAGAPFSPGAGVQRVVTLAALLAGAYLGAELCLFERQGRSRFLAGGLGLLVGVALSLCPGAQGVDAALAHGGFAALVLLAGLSLSRLLAGRTARARRWVAGALSLLSLMQFAYFGLVRHLPV